MARRSVVRSIFFSLRNKKAKERRASQRRLWMPFLFCCTTCVRTLPRRKRPHRNTTKMHLPISFFSFFFEKEKMIQRKKKEMLSYHDGLFPVPDLRRTKKCTR